jgi:acetyl esterase/lipase
VAGRLLVAVGRSTDFAMRDVDHALRLNQAGAPCELHVYPGVPRGYQIAQDASVVQETAHHIDDWLAAQVAR